MELANPFTVTKAVDFSDEEIKDTWVDFPGPHGEGFFQLVDPQSPMPRLLLGGKGCGRTHLMRYYSYALQKLRHADDPAKGIQDEGYLGVYVRCSGLNAGRFAGKGQSDDIWSATFQYYMDLWLAQVAAATVADVVSGSSLLPISLEAEVSNRIWELFDSPPSRRPPASLKDLLRVTHQLQGELDIAVNNAAFSHELAPRILETRGKLVFGLPQAVIDAIPQWRRVRFVYLIDELENLTEPQQKYVNTLVREKQPPASFIIGARSYGVRTFETFSGDEENREGSEYEATYLDRHYEQHRDAYRTFARRLVAKRLTAFGPVSNELPSEQLANRLRLYFEEPGDDGLLEVERSSFLRRYPDSSDRPYFRKLASQLREARASLRTQRILAPGDESRVLHLLALPSNPLLEKVNIFLLYQEWAGRKPLLPAAERINASAAQYLGSARNATDHARVLKYFRTDLAAQLVRDLDHPQRYAGLDTFIAMSSGLPRNLLIILKHIHKWATFRAEAPYSTTPISVEAQRLGATEASNWFFEDARVLGSSGPEVHEAISRLGDMLRAMRFTDKPVETSLISFSGDLSIVSRRAQQTIRLAEQWSLLMRIGVGQRDRNTGAVKDKYQMSGMLCPRWDLPVFRRGTIDFDANELEAIFDSARAAEFPRVVDKRVRRMSAPFRARDHLTRVESRSEQLHVPGTDD